MPDVARDEIDHEIAHLLSVEQMLLHLAQVVEEAAPHKREHSDTYKADAEAALRYGAYLAKHSRESWEHIRARIDARQHGDPTV